MRPWPRPPFFFGVNLVPSLGTEVTATNIAARVAAFLNNDLSITSLLPIGGVVTGIIPDGTGWTGPAIAVQIIEEKMEPYTLGGAGVGSDRIRMTLAAVVQVRQTDRNGTPTLTLKQEQDATDALRKSLRSMNRDTGTPRLWQSMTPGLTRFASVSGERRSGDMVEVVSVPVKKT